MTFKKIVLSIAFNILFFSAFAQGTSLTWANQITAYNMDAVTIEDIETDQNGNIITVGHFSGSVDFDPSSGGVFTLDNPWIPSSLPDRDLYISKSDSAGNLIWAKQIKCGSDIFARDMDVDDNGNIYVTGDFRDTADFDPGPGTYLLSCLYIADDDFYILKLDGNGNFKWAHSFGTNGWSDGQNIDVDNNGFVHIVGGFDNKIDFDPSPNNFILTASVLGNQEPFILKLDSLGGFIWAKKISSNSKAYVRGFSVDENSNLILAGHFNDSVDFDPGTGVSYLIDEDTGYTEDAFIMKLNSSGNFQWVKQFKSSSGALITHLCTDTLGNIYSFGNFLDSLDVDPSNQDYFILSGIQRDCFINKLGENGDLKWVRQFTGDTEVWGSDMTLSNNKLYVGGYFFGTINFSPGSTSHTKTSVSNADTYYCKLNTSGDFYWVNQINTHIPNPISLATYQVRDVYVAGRFSGTVDFDPGPMVHNMSSKGNDTYTIKLSDLTVGIKSVKTDNQIKIYPNPAGSEFRILFKGISQSEVGIILRDLSGRVVYNERDIEPVNNVLSVSYLNLKPGIYIVEVHQGGEKFNGKIVIQ